MGIKSIREYVTILRSHKVSRALIITLAPPSSLARKGVSEMQKEECYLEILSRDFFKYNVMEHELVPPHRKLSIEEKKQILCKYRATDDQMPIIKKKDVVARYLGLDVGDMVEIKRVSATAGETLFYRVCKE